MLRYLKEMNREPGAPDLILKIGVHCGEVIAVNMNQKRDYFGQTVNIAARVQSLAGAEQVFVTEDVYTHPSFGNRESSFEKVMEKVHLRGIEETTTVYKLV